MPVVTTGSKSSAAIESGTIWGPGGWNSWAGGNENVFQGSYGSGPVYGAWFYGGSFGSLNDGRAITRVQFRTGRRRPVGASSSPVTFHFYLHTNPTRPGGDVNRVQGPFDVVLNPGEAPKWIDLPAGWGAGLVAGGGIGIAGEPYAAMDGRLVQADSGALILDWRK